MCQWRFYDGGEHNNYESQIWQLVDSNGEVIKEYEIEQLKLKASDWDIWEGEQQGQYIIWNDN